MNNNRKINWYTQGQRLAARVLFMVWLLGNCGLQSVLAVPGGQEAVLVNKASGSVLSRVLSYFGGGWNEAPLGAYRTTAEPVAEGQENFEQIIQSAEDGCSIPAASLTALFEDVRTDLGVRYALNQKLAKVQNLALAEKRDVEIVYNAIEDEDSNVRIAAIKILGKLTQVKLNPTRALPLLCKATKILHQYVREAAVEAFMELGVINKESCIPVFYATRDEDRCVREAADKAITRFKAIDWGGVLISLTLEEAANDQNDADVRRKAFHAIEYLAAKDPSSLTRASLLILHAAANNDQDKYVRVAAVQALGEWSVSGLSSLAEDSLPIFYTASKDQNSGEVRLAAIRALGKVGVKYPQFLTEAFLTIVREAAKYDQSEYVRAEAVETLMKLGVTDNETSIVLQDRALQDQKYLVRLKAVKALGKFIPNYDRIWVLLHSIKDSDDSVGRTAVQVFTDLSRRGAIGSATLSILVPTLQNAAVATENYKYVRVAAIKALGELDDFADLTSEDASTRKSKEEYLTFLLKIRVRFTEDWDLHQAAFEVFEILKTKDNQALVAFLCKNTTKDQEELVRKGAVLALKQIGDNHSTTLMALFKAKTDPNDAIRLAAARSYFPKRLPAGQYLEYLEYLGKMAKDQSESLLVRQAAIEEFQDFEGLEPAFLTALLDDVEDNEQLAPKAAEVLQNAASYLIRASKDPDSNVRLAAVNDLEELAARLEGKKHEEVLKALQDAKKMDPYRSVRDAAAQAIENMQVAATSVVTSEPDNINIQRLLNQAKSSSFTQNETAFSALMQLNYPQQISSEDLIALLKITLGNFDKEDFNKNEKDDIIYRVRYLTEYRLAESDLTGEVLCNVLKGAKKNQKKCSAISGAFEFLKTISRETLEELLNLSTNDEYTISRAADDALENLKSLNSASLTIEVLSEAIEGKHGDVRGIAVIALGKLCATISPTERDAMLPALQQATQDNAASVRSLAVWALGKLCAVDTKPDEVLKILQDKVLENYGPQSSVVRHEAVVALGELCATISPTERNAMLPALQQATQDNAASVRYSAVWALGKLAKLDKLGDKCDEVLRALRAVANSENEEGNVRQAAEEALKSFSEETPSTS